MLPPPLPTSGVAEVSGMGRMGTAERLTQDASAAIPEPDLAVDG